MATIHADCRFAFRSDTAVNWQTNNPTLLKGEIGTVTDGSESEKMKIGDGVTPWNSLGWFKGEKGEQGIQGIKGDRGLQGEKGNSGFSPIATVNKSGTKATITITDENGTTTAEVNDGVTPAVDQTYSDTSPNAQSGKAVAKAVNDLKIATDTKIHFRKIKDITVQAMETQPNSIVVTVDNDLKSFSLSRIVVEVVIPVGSLTGSYNISFWIPDGNGYNTQVIFLIGTPSSASYGSVTVADITNVGGKAIAQAVSNRTITNPLNMLMRNAGLPSQSVTPIWGLANTITKFQVGLGSSQLWAAGTTITIWGIDA